MRVAKISLLPYHNFGQDKYRRLKRECTQHFIEPSQAKLAEIQALYQAAGYQVSIGG